MHYLLETLGLPPTGFVLAIGAGLLLRLLWPRTGMTIAVVSLVLLLMAGMPVVADNLLDALEVGLPTTPPADHPPQAIVVLSAEIIRAPDEPLGVRPGLLSLDRLRTAAALHRRTGLPLLVSGGVGQPDLPSLAAMLQQSLTDDFQTPAKWVEDRSVDTWENAHFSAEILKKAGITSIYLVTSSWHMRRALLSFQGTGMIVTAAPTSLDAPLGPDPGDFLPRVGAWQTCFYAVHEWVGYAWYRLR